MSLYLKNTLSRKKEKFIPLNHKEIKLYSCGPTVYNYPHIGNYRAYIFSDILKRTLIYKNFKVKHIMNLTDIDDKTIKNSQKEGKSLKEFTEFYTKAFFEDIKKLNIIPPYKFTKATDYIKEMVSMTEKLLQKGFAYKSSDNSIYFDIKKFKNYGKLTKIKIKNQKKNAQGRIKKDEYDKENVQDFALWKAYDKEDGNIFWETSLGKGRPGWHIECSAMSISNLGEEIDIHTGGVDNIFPHHENEIAQSESATGKNFVQYWLHNEWVLVNNKKMSKSLGNFYILSDLEKKNFSPIAYRFWLLMAHYRTRVNFTWEALESASNALKKIYVNFAELGEKTGKINKDYKEKFLKAVEDDLNTPKAISLIWEILKNKKISNEDKKATLLDFDKIFGLELKKIKSTLEIKIYDNIIIQEKIILDKKTENLLIERKKAKEQKNYLLSDEIRKKIELLGYIIKDTNEGQKISKKL